MNDFLKDNIALVAAIVLPLVLVVIFALSTALVSVSVEDPRYSFFVATNYPNSQNSAFSFNVIDEKLVVSYRPEVKNENDYYTNTSVPRLWKINIPSGSVEEIALPVPANKKAADISIAGVTDIKIRNIQPAPDGYSFSNTYPSDSNIMTMMFSADGRSRNSVALEKDGRRFKVKVPGDDWYYNSDFIGWIINDE